MIQGYLSVSKEILEQLKHTTSIEENLSVLKQAEFSMDIGKTWQFLTYLLTEDKYGNKHFLSSLFCPKNSTIVISDDEYDYLYHGDDENRIREIEKKVDINTLYLKPKEIEGIVKYLQKISIIELFNNCDFEEVRKIRIYPDNWDVSEGHRNYITENFNKLLQFLEVALKSKNYVIVEVPGM
ncbi:MAG: DUF1877 family protein [Saprospiraceae bacterium]